MEDCKNSLLNCTTEECILIFYARLLTDEQRKEYLHRLVKCRAGGVTESGDLQFSEEKPSLSLVLPLATS